MACDHCKEIGFKLSIISKKTKLPPIFLILVGEKEDEKLFFDETHLDFPYQTFEIFTFLKNYQHATWPWIILTENGKITKQWIYPTFEVTNFNKEMGKVQNIQ
jgi:hypothetical protein